MISANIIMDFTFVFMKFTPTGRQEKARVMTVFSKRQKDIVSFLIRLSPEIVVNSKK